MKNELKLRLSQLQNLTKKWDKTFRNYLEECDYVCTEYWCYPGDELDKILSKFWFEVCTTEDPVNDEDENSTHPELYNKSL